MSTLDRFKLDGHVPVVTGSGRGIGRAIALALAEAGECVAMPGHDTAHLTRVDGSPAGQYPCYTAA